MTSLSLPQDFLSSGILVKIMSATRSGPMYCNALPLGTSSTCEKCGPLAKKIAGQQDTTTAWQMILGSSPQLVAFATQLCFDSDWSYFRLTQQHHVWLWKQRKWLTRYTKKKVCSSWHVTVISSNHPILAGFCAKQLCDTMVVDAACG